MDFEVGDIVKHKILGSIFFIADPGETKVDLYAIVDNSENEDYRKHIFVLKSKLILICRRADRKDIQ